MAHEIPFDSATGSINGTPGNILILRGTFYSAIDTASLDDGGQWLVSFYGGAGFVDISDQIDELVNITSPNSLN